MLRNWQRSIGFAAVAGVLATGAAPAHAEPLTLPDRGGPAAADRASKVDRSGMPSRPELISVIWKTRSKPSSTITVNFDGTTIGARDVVKTAELALRQSFGQVAATFSPPLKLKIEVTRFDVQRQRNGLTFLVDTVARDASSGEMLYRDRGESSCELLPGTDDDGMQKSVALALRDLADDASNRMLNREFRTWDSGPDQRPKWWLGVAGGGPLLATVNGTWWWSEQWSLALAVAPLAPRLGLSLAAQRELHRVDDLAFGVGLGLGRALNSTLIETCDQTAHSCPPPKASTWAQLDTHLAWYLGARKNHRLALALYLLYEVEDDLVGDPGERGLGGSFSASWQYGF